MKVKLTKIKGKKNPTNKYIIDVKCMHGDADAYTHEQYNCKDEADFISVMTAFDNMPQASSSGGDEDTYDTWCSDTFGEDLIPWDVTGYDCRSTVDSLEGYYYDENGIKFKAEITK